jgi:5-aminolevulinate synthase
VRSHASGFIFTTSLSPAPRSRRAAGMRHLRRQPGVERDAHQRSTVILMRQALQGPACRRSPSQSHIVPVMVCDPVLCKAISDSLLDEFGIYVQPINYPTVPRGTERLRITPSPLHSNADIDHLVDALSTIWRRIGLSKAAAE